MANKELRLKGDGRTYHFPGGEKVTIANPRKLVVKPSGNHHVTDADGNRHVINGTWLKHTDKA